MRRLSPCDLLRLALCGLLAIAPAACGGTDSTTPVTPSPATTTETFSESIAHAGAAVHSFTVAATGTVKISLTSVSPLATMGLGVGLGSWDGTTCGASISYNDNAKAGATALSGTANAGKYCVRVYDSGNVPEDWSVSYTVEVAHP